VRCESVVCALRKSRRSGEVKIDPTLNRFSISKKVVGFIAILLATMLGISVYSFRGKDWDEAQRCFDPCLEINPSDKPSQVFGERIKVLRENPPLDKWDGVWRMTKK
jgi:hypothetical protein